VSGYFAEAFEEFISVAADELSDGCDSQYVKIFTSSRADGEEVFEVAGVIRQNRRVHRKISCG
jgi:hypothetical protein